ncbi:hypothetical protein INN71_01835 [Nocardioides sp. ChNu-153]|uniref:hypothetical protein n=1 Tax=unclassified Nocardioides TaxID=2615069 RepID=UPI002406386A|nr:MULTISPECIES: hypothetical protein [unclassified Nocardioides]MDF9714747.1 hypothetical protein [Nocardioides sp. ChNu-99]MDN7120126.1 hypothetical protein [Nocardioides sp. ChNu-153]
MNRPVPALAALVVLALGTVACTGDDGGDGDAPVASPTTTAPPALADLDTTTLGVERSAFCDDVTDEAVAAALGAPPVEAVPWDTGAPTQIAPGREDLVHEVGCRWYGEGGAAAPTSPAASAWVFVPPTTPAAAAAYVEETAATEGCRVLEGQPAYGAPSLAQLCGAEGVAEVSFRGLLGDAWLTCTLRVPTSAAFDEAATVTRASDWCAAVAVAAGP